EQCPQILVAALGDLAQDRAISGQLLLGYESQPGTEVASLRETCAVADRRHHGARSKIVRRVGGKSMSITRRQVLATAGSFALTAASKGPAAAAMGPNDKFDLVIKGGDVLDPSQGLRGKRDIGIRFGVIEALEADIPAERAQRVLDASGKLVTPGLVDLHT